MKIRQFLEDELQTKPGSVKISMQSQIDKFHEKYELLKSSKQIRSTLYRVNPGNRVFIHVKVPSQSLKQFYYDVLFELIGNDKTKRLEDCDIKLFSNSPSFVYGGYAYLFYHMSSDPNDTKSNTGMMIDIFRNKIPADHILISGTEKKLGKDAVHNEPVVRNPMGIPLPDFSIYCGFFHLIETYRYDTVMQNRNTIHVSRLIKDILDFDHLMIERKRVLHAEKEKKRLEEEREKQENEKQLKRSMRTSSRQNGMTKMQSAKSMSTTKRASGMHSLKKAHTTRRG